MQAQHLVSPTKEKIKYWWSLKKMYRRLGPKKIKNQRNDENYSMRQTGCTLLFNFNLSPSWDESSALSPGLEKSPHYPLNRRLGGPQCWSGHFVGEEISCPFQDSNHGLSSLQPGHYADYDIPVICKITVVITELLCFFYIYLSIFCYYLLSFCYINMVWCHVIDLTLLNSH